MRMYVCVRMRMHACAVSAHRVLGVGPRLPPTICGRPLGGERRGKCSQTWSNGSRSKVRVCSH